MTLLALAHPLIVTLALIGTTAEARVDALLAAMGGRDAWAQTRFVHVRAWHRDDTTGEIYENQIWNDFSAPRVTSTAM